MKNLCCFFLSAGLLLTACNGGRQPAQEGTDTSGMSGTTTGSAIADTLSGRNFPAGPVPNTVMTEDYVRMMAHAIYLWGWPMTNIHNRKITFQNAPGSLYMGGIVPIAPPNHLTMLTDYIEPGEREVACPNQNVAYGFGTLDLSQEAVVLQVPDFGDRFWVYQVCNQRTDGFASIGKMYGTKPGFYLLTGPGWNDKVPDGISQVFKCNTALGVVIPRVFMTDDPADKQAAQSMIQQINAYPLSQFDGKMKTIDWTKTPKTPAEKKDHPGETQWVKPESYFDELPAIMQEVPPLPGEEALYSQIRALLDAITKKPVWKKIAIQAAFEADKSLVNPLFNFVNVGYPLRYNWTTQSNGAQFGTDYLTRTACAKANIFVNKPNETKYFYQDLDSGGVRLHGNNKYTLTFVKGGLPPVKGFWSLTLYDEHHFFAPNELKRFSLGTKNKTLQYNADGSLTLYVQNTTPGADKVSNWLPAPKAPFSLYIRTYWPEEIILNGQWIPPAVVKVK